MTRSSTLDSTTTSSNTELSGKVTHHNTTKSGTPQKTSTMQNTQSNDSTGASQESPVWIHVTINRSTSAPPPIIKPERGSYTPESDAQHIARNATPTSPEYSGSPKKGGGTRLHELDGLYRPWMSNPSQRETRVRLVPTIHEEIEKTKCRPRIRLATGDGSEPRRGLGPTKTTSSA